MNHDQPDTVPCAARKDLDNPTRTRVARRLQVAKPEVVQPSVNPVDDQIGLPGQFVLKASVDHPPQHRRCEAVALNGDLRRIKLNAGHRPVKRLDDVAAVTQRLQSRLKVIDQNPARRARRPGQAKSLERTRAAQEPAMIVAVASAITAKINPAVGRQTAKRPVEGCQALGLDLTIQAGRDLPLGPGSKLQSDQGLSLIA